jgi:hypothetical protein
LRTGEGRYEGPVNAQGLPEGRGVLLRKKEGYHEKEYVAYEGEFLAGKKHGSGVLYHAGTNVSAARIECGIYDLQVTK